MRSVFRLPDWSLRTRLLVLLVALAAGLLYGALTTERGTAYAWHAAVRMLGGRLAGTLDGGTLAHGVQLRDVRWRSLDGSGTEIQVDRVAGRWALAREPWRFTIEYLHVGTIDARLGASTSSIRSINRENVSHASRATRSCCRNVTSAATLPFFSMCLSINSRVCAWPSAVAEVLLTRWNSSRLTVGGSRPSIMISGTCSDRASAIVWLIHTNGATRASVSPSSIMG